MIPIPNPIYIEKKTGFGIRTTTLGVNLTLYPYVRFLSYWVDGFFCVLCWVDWHFVFNQGTADVIWKCRKHVYLQ